MSLLSPAFQWIGHTIRQPAAIYIYRDFWSRYQQSFFYPKIAFKNFQETWPKIEWAFILVNLIFSSTFITLILAVVLVNREARHFGLLFISWVFSSLISVLVLIGRIIVGSYHFSLIILDLFCFITVKLSCNTFFALRSARNSLIEDPQHELLTKMERALSYQAAIALEDLKNIKKWKEYPESRLYEWEALQEHYFKLKQARELEDIEALLFLLRISAFRDFCGISNPRLFSHAHTGTKYLVHNFMDEFCACLRVLRDIALQALEKDPTSYILLEAFNQFDQKRTPCLLYPTESPRNDFITNIPGFFHYMPHEGNSEQRLFPWMRNKVDVSTQTHILPTLTRVASCPMLKSGVCQYGSDKLSKAHVDSLKMGDCSSKIRPVDIPSPKVSLATQDESIPFISSEFDHTKDAEISRRKSVNKQTDFTSTSMACSGDSVSLYAMSTRSERNSIDKQSNSVHLQQILRFFFSLRLSLGRTALCLSGGGSLAMYHIGIVRCLLDRNILPRVISGTSGGAIVAGVLAIFNDDELLNDILKPDIVTRYKKRWFPPMLKQIHQFILKGQMLDEREFESTCRAYYREYTFREAFSRTGRLVSIVVTPANRSPGQALILNHISTPDVLLWSAVMTSCSLPGLLPPQQLMARGPHGKPVPYSPLGLKWMDGSISLDLPVQELSSLFNVKQFIVSQVNPHFAPFVESWSHDSRALRVVENWLTMDMKHRYAKLAKFNMVPKILGHDLSTFWMIQEFEGNVTITPRASLVDYYRMINQPTIEDMKDFITQGEARTWPHCARIEHTMQVAERH